MKGMKVTLMLISLLTLMSCSGPSSPKFNGLKDLKVTKARLNNVALAGQALYTNENSIGGTLLKTDVTIAIDGVEITKINQSEELKVPANDDFSVPVIFSFNPRSLVKENDGFLKNSLKNLLNKEVTVDYSGSVVISIAGIEFDVPVDYSEKVNIGLNFN